MYREEAKLPNPVAQIDKRGRGMWNQMEMYGVGLRRSLSGVLEPAPYARLHQQSNDLRGTGGTVTLDELSRAILRPNNENKLRKLSWMAVRLM